MKRSTATVLALEDCEEDFRVLSETCERHAFPIRLVRFETAAPLISWLESSEAGSFELAILDVRTYGGGGVEVLEKMRASPHWKCVPVVMVSASNNPREIRRCYELGANTFVVKPLETATQYLAYEKILQYWLELADLDVLHVSNRPSIKAE